MSRVNSRNTPFRFTSKLTVAPEKPNNIMHDRRVVRGSTYSRASLPDEKSLTEMAMLWDLRRRKKRTWGLEKRWKEEEIKVNGWWLLNGKKLKTSRLKNRLKSLLQGYCYQFSRAWRLRDVFKTVSWKTSKKTQKLKTRRLEAVTPQTCRGLFSTS